MTSGTNISDNSILAVARIVLLTLLVVYTSVRGQQHDVNILQSTSEGVVVEYIPQYYTPTKFNSNGIEFLRYDFANSKMIGAQSAGSPDMHTRSLLFRFPGSKNNTIEILNVDYEDIPNITLIPTPLFERGEVDPVPKYIPNSEAYNISGFVPQEVGSLISVGETRGVFLGEVRINPLQYDASRRLLRKNNRIVARINFGAAEKPRKPTEPMLRLALNDAVFSSIVPQVKSEEKATLHNSVLSAGSWFRFNIIEAGIYKLTGQVLLDAGIPSSTDPRTIKIYNNGGIELPQSPTIKADDDLIQNAIFLHDAGTIGVLDASDYIIFYGKGTSGWNYNRTSK